MAELQSLFTLELQYEPNLPPLAADPGHVGEYLGSGQGTVTGKRIQGSVRWDLFEKPEARACATNLRGIITTEDGATIQFDTLGFFHRPDKPDDPIWLKAAGVSFETADERYAWLNPLVGVWQGSLDMRIYHHRYQVYGDG